MKKLVSIFLSLVLITFQMNVVTVFANTTSGEYTYSVSNSTAKIIGYTGSGGNVTIPSEIDGYTVTSIDGAFDSCSSLTSVTIPSSVTSIGNCTFFECSKLTSITIPNSVTSIGASAFESCSSLTSITIPSSVISIGCGTFYGCSKLTSITIPSSVTSIDYYAFDNCSGLTSITIPSSVKSIGDKAFINCSSNLVIYYHNTAIGFTNPWNGFKTVACNIVSYNGNGNTAGTVPVDNNMYTQGTKATIINNTGNLVKTGYTFAGWNTAADGSGTSYPADSIVSMNGADITLYAQWKASISPNSGDYTYFVSNSTAKIIGYTGPGGNVTIPSQIDGYTVTSIGDFAFDECNNLTSITIPSSVTSIGYRAFFNCSKLTNITIPSGVTSIGNYAFVGCTSLTSINVDDYNTAYSSLDGALYNKLKTTLISYPAGKPNSTFVVPSSVTNIGESAFDECGSLTSITIPDSVTSIGESAFFYCHSLTSITIPSSVTSINDYAFAECSSLTSITIPSSVKSIGDEAFYNCSSNIVIYYHNTAIGFTNPWNGIKTVACNIVSYNGNGNTAGTVPVDNNVYAPGSKASILNNTGNLVKTGYLFSGWNTAADGSGTSYPPDSNILMNGTDITLYAQWKTEYKYSVSNSTATIIGYTGPGGNVTIPSQIDGYTVTSIDGAFHSCSSLTSVTIPSSVTSIGNCTFFECSKLTSITIPSSVTSIGASAFESCSSLTSITIPSSVTNIGDIAFYGCSSLTSITIPTSITSIGYCVFDNCSGLTSITIPSSVTSISDRAFVNCSSLTSITIPSSVTNIGDKAFLNCPSNLIIYYHNTAIGFTNPWNGFKTVACNIVSYNGNGNTSGTVPVDNNVYASGSTASILNNTGSLAKTGYLFAGWNTAADGSGTSYPANSIVSMNGADITLYAQWIALISPASGTFVKGEATDLTTVITTVNKTLNPITGIYNGETKLIDGTDEKITDTDTGYTLTLNKSYLSKLTTSNTVITIKFKDGSSLSYTAIETIPTDRISGDNRFETAAEISKKGWTTTSEYAIIATGEDYPDALCAAPLAKKYGAPIILTEKNKLSDAAKNELTRLSVKKVFIVGGTGAVSSDVETEITNLGILPTRISGADRYETSLNIAKQLGINNPPTAINIATGDNFADALSISSIAAMKGEPILLTSKDSINDDIKQYIKDNSSTITASYIIGGTGVISDAVANSLKNPIRLYGKNRYETNTAVLNYFKNDLNLSNIYLATGDNFPDALAASALAAETKSPILLVGSSVDDSTKSFINNNNSILKITAVGGTGVISDDILKEF